MNVNSIVKESCLDGPGIRYVIFVQGCPHHCKGCHNQETWSYKNNKIISVEEIFNEIKKDPLINGVTFSGGEPFTQQQELTKLAKMIHSINLNIWCYTGFLYDQIKNTELAKNVDVIVDGKFELENRKIENFKGSTNQKIYFINII